MYRTMPASSESFESSNPEIATRRIPPTEVVAIEQFLAKCCHVREFRTHIHQRLLRWDCPSPQCKMWLFCWIFFVGTPSRPKGQITWRNHHAKGCNQEAYVQTWCRRRWSGGKFLKHVPTIVSCNAFFGFPRPKSCSLFFRKGQRRCMPPIFGLLPL